MFIRCWNSKCQNYYEDNCTLAFEDKNLSLDYDGKCTEFKEGKSDYYKSSKCKCKFCGSKYEEKDLKFHGKAIGKIYCNCWEIYKVVDRV